MKKRRGEDVVSTSVSSSLAFPPEKMRVIQTALVRKPSTAFNEYLRESEEEWAVRLIQKAIAPQLLEVINRLARNEIELQELHYALQQNPEFRRRYLWREHGIQKAQQLLTEYTPKLALHKIRRLLEEILKVDKRTAEDFLKAAQERIHRTRDKDQTGMEDWT